MNEQHYKDLLSIQSQMHIVLLYLERDKNSINEYIKDIKDIDYKLKNIIESLKDDE